MVELKGKYNMAKIFTDNVDNETISQVINLLNQESIKDSKIRIMPDTHAGAGCVIGTAMTLTDKVIPNLVGVDIGCFTGDTPVWCGSNYLPIKDLAERGNNFITDSFNLKQKLFVASDATARLTRHDAELVMVTYGAEYCNEISVRCTPDHKFLVSLNPEVYYNSPETDIVWVEAKDLKEGMRLVAEDISVFVKSVEKLKEKEDVYCLTVPDEHNFTIIGGVIVHNCGMLAIKLKEKDIDLSMFDNVIRKYVPCGGNVHKQPKVFKTSIDVEYLACYGKHGASIRVGLAYQSVGTLGSGNHFIEVDKDESGDLWLVIHTGSRHLGLEVCNYYQNIGYQRMVDKVNNFWTSEENVAKKRKDLLANLKKNNQQKLIEQKLKEFDQKVQEARDKSKISTPFELAYVEGQDFKDYIHDMNMVQKHASCNRKEIARIILKYAELHEVEQFETIHNYIDTGNMILRKGSVSAQKGEKLIIPINMRDGSLICIGKGNEDWNFSAPHGAGRIMSRSKAKESFTVSEFKKTMDEANIFTTSVGQSTLDECPMTYKPMQEIINNIEPTVDIINIIKPIYNFKAGEE